jgi:cell division protein FtsQ
MSRRISAAKRQPVLRAVVRTAAELALLAALGLWAAAALEAGLQRPTRTVLVDGRFERVQVPEVEELLRPQLGVPLADVDLDQVRHEVERLPWVATVQAERRWPDTLRITVRERRAVARWGDLALLDEHARIFAVDASEMPDGLPRLSAPPAQAQTALTEFRLLSERLRGSAMEVSELALDARGEWRAVTSGGVELRLGTAAPQTQVPLLRAAVTRALEARLEQVRYVDLRYANGFAVAWKTEAEAPNDTRKDPGGNGNG